MHSCLAEQDPKADKLLSYKMNAFYEFQDQWIVTSSDVMSQGDPADLKTASGNKDVNCSDDLHVSGRLGT